MNPDALRWRFALRAFPKRFRVARRTELLDTMSEAASFGKAPGIRDHLDIIRAGWSERRRTRPPLGRYLGYRYFNRRLAERWHPWMLDDLGGWYFVRRAFFNVVPPQAPMVLVLTATRTMPPPFVFKYLAIVFTAMFILVAAIDRAGRRRFSRGAITSVLDRHGYDLLADGNVARRTLPDPVPLRWVPIPPPLFVRAGPILSWWGAALTIAIPVGVVAHFAPGVLPSVLKISERWSLARDPLDHQWGLGVAGLIGSAIVGVISAIGMHRYGLKVIASMTSTHTPQRTAPATAASLGGALLTLLIAIGGVVRYLPMILPWLVLVAGGAGPAMLVLASRVRSFEQQSGARCWIGRESASATLPVSSGE